MKYCQRCVLPDTRPNLSIDSSGICNACLAHQSKIDIDWNRRKAALEQVFDHAKSRSQGYDCIIPVSGGKDSTWQVITCLEYGLKPLAVTWKTPARTTIGQENLNNLISLGVDHIDYQISPKVEKKFLYQSLKQYGTTGIPMHMALFNIPLRLAVNFSIPLVVWGENSAFEYGGTTDEQKGFKLDAKWLKTFGVTHGTTAIDWVSEQLTQKELTPYFGPDDQELESKGILAIFLGYYLGWDPEQSRTIATQHGFKSGDKAKTGLYNFADIDDDFISIHHYLKWYKFGFTRLFDNLTLEIRNQRITRQKALDVLQEYGEQRPDEDIDKFCQFIAISRSHFFEIIEPFRNLNIWKKQQGVWKIQNFIIDNWRWS